MKKLDITFDFGDQGTSKSGKAYKVVTAGSIEVGAEVITRIARPDLIDTTGMSIREARRANGNAINTHFDVKIVGVVEGLGEAYPLDNGHDSPLVQRAYYTLTEA